MKKTMILAAMAAVMFASCSKENNGGEIFPAGTTALNLSGTTQAVVSKASTVTMPAGYHVGIYTPLTGTELSSVMTAPAVNKEYLSDGMSLTSTPPTYLELTRGYDIYGYAPFKSNGSDPIAIEFTHADDVLWSPKVTIAEVSNENRSANLVFGHMTSQAKFVVVIDPMFDSDDDSEPDHTEVDATTSIKVTGFAEKAALTLADGTMTLTEGTSPVIEATATEVSSGKFELSTGAPVCFFIPSGVPKALTVEVTHAGVKLTGTINRVWVAGESYTYTITATKNSTVAVLGMTAEIIEWVPVTGSLTVE